MADFGNGLSRGLKSSLNTLEDLNVGDELDGLKKELSLNNINNEVTRATGGTVVPDVKAATAPAPDDLNARRARQREAARRYANTGRAGTILSGDGNKLG